VLVSYVNETGEVLKEAKGYYYLITFHPDGTYSGKAYGNEMGGKYKLNGKKIQINPGDITKIAVEGSDPDRFFLEHLADVYTYTITDMELRLYYSKDQYFKFRINNDQL
jgi:heat shock protein HslJ